ncbi:MAG: glycosyl hydrolase family 18 protein [Clostridia bacterium]|nr:glycosyl hydrolase family 18 protein [Clostridia bacterium]
MKNRIALLITIFLLLGGILAVAYYYFVPNTSVVPAFSEDKLNLVIGGNVISSKDNVKIKDGEILLPFSIVKEYIDKNIYWDSTSKKVTVTTKDRVIRMRTESLQALVNNKPVNLKLSVSVEKDVVFIPIEFLSDFYKIQVKHIKENNVVVIDYAATSKQIAEPTRKSVAVRSGTSIRYPVIKRIAMEQKPEERALRVFEETDKWYKVRTADGSIGYVEKKSVSVKTVTEQGAPPEEPKSNAWKPAKGKISVTWEMMYEGVADVSKLKKIDGIDVVSPTWFQVANEKGDLINRAVPKYMDWAHKNGYKVWAMLTNDFGDTKMTHKLLNSTDARENLIRQILAFASLYKLDGINIDFENINIQDKDALTQFVREITPFLREQGLVVSMCVSPMDGSENWSLCYDRKSIGESVDYVMLMAYDQSWPSFGPNAQLSWVEKNMKKVMEQVPKEKLILGVPFYSRLWKEETDKSGKKKTSYAKSLSIEAALKTIKENKASVKWEEASGQFYAEYKKDGISYKFWLEDKSSIELKASLVHKYQLAGAAVWSANFGEEAAWKSLAANLKGIGNYDEWAQKNANRKYSLD